MPHHHNQPVPRAALIGAAALIVTAVTLAALSRQGLIGRPQDIPADQSVAVVDLTFVDLQEGGIAVRRADTGETVEILRPGDDGFVRGVLRSLVRERRQHGLGADQPFRLLRQSDGRLTLLDAATNRRIELVSFGPTNARAFGRFLQPGEGM